MAGTRYRSCLLNPQLPQFANENGFIEGHMGFTLSQTEEKTLYSQVLRWCTELVSLNSKTYITKTVLTATLLSQSPPGCITLPLWSLFKTCACLACLCSLYTMNCINGDKCLHLYRIGSPEKHACCCTPLHFFVYTQNIMEVVVRKI